MSFFPHLLSYFIEPVIITCLGSYFFPNMVLIARLFAQDSFTCSTRYLLGHLSFPVPNREVSVFAKYLFYMGLSLGYYAINLLTWFSFPYQYYLYQFLVLLTCPVIQEALLRSQSWLLEELEQFQKKMVNYSACLCLSKSLNYVCVSSIGCNPKISTHELDDVLGMQNLHYIWSFLKILLVTTLIKYLKKSSYVYGRILKMLYSSGNLIELPKYHNSMIIDAQTKNPKETLSKIITKRKWYYFYDPAVLNIVIRLYQEGEGNILQDIVNSLKKQTFQFLSMWTLCRFIPIPFLAFLFRLRETYPSNLVIPAVDCLLLLLFPHKLFWICLFSEFSPYIKGIACQLITQLASFTPQIYRVLCHYNKYNVYLTLSIPVVAAYAQVDPHLLLALPVITKYNFIYMWMVTFGYFSNYALAHLFTLSLMLYFIINLVDYRNTPSKHAKVDIIKSYWPDTASQSATTTNQMREIKDEQDDNYISIKHSH